MTPARVAEDEAEAGGSPQADAEGATRRATGLRRPEDTPAPDQRTRILETALALMGEQGAQMTSMRRLAAACSLNVATLYHYFPSKAAILQAVIEDKRYAERMHDDPAPVDDSLAPRERLATLMRTIFEGALADEATLRLVIGESLRGEQVALDAVTGLSETLEETLHAWLVGHFPELPGDPDVVARVLRDQVFSFCVESLATTPTRRKTRLLQRATDMAALAFPD